MYGEFAFRILFAIGVGNVVDSPDIESDNIVVFSQIILDICIGKAGFKKLFAVGATLLSKISDDAIFTGFFCFFKIIAQITQRKLEPVRTSARMIVETDE